jgi:hypothetical protein
MEPYYLSKSNCTNEKKEKRIMKTNRFLLTIVVLGALLIAGCASEARVGELRTESQSVELGDTESVRVEIEFGAGNLDVTGGAEDLLEADFTYNVDELKPEVVQTGSTLIIRQPDITGLPDLLGITDYRYEWNLRFNDEVPMDLRVDLGGGTSNLELAGLSLTGLDVNLGAGENTVDLSGDWAQDLDATIDAGAGNITVRLPKDTGVRVKAEAGLGTIEAPGLTKDGDVYTNAAYGESEVTLRLDLEAGVGRINLELEE